VINLNQYNTGMEQNTKFQQLLNDTDPCEMLYDTHISFLRNNDPPSPIYDEEESYDENTSYYYENEVMCIPNQVSNIKFIWG